MGLLALICLLLSTAIGKKVELIGKKKGNSKVLEWAHVYWCAASSNGNGALVKEKWLSILNRIVDQHTGHGTIYKDCPHEKVKCEWLKKGRYALHFQVQGVQDLLMDVVCGPVFRKLSQLPALVVISSFMMNFGCFAIFWETHSSICKLQLKLQVWFRWQHQVQIHYLVQQGTRTRKSV